MRRLLMPVCAAALCAASSAHAADGGAAEALAYTWTGLYGGINVGYGRGSSEWDFEGGGSNTRRVDGGLVGLQAGYDAQLGNHLMLGLEATIEATNSDGRHDCGGALAGSSCRTRLRSVSDVSARLGLAEGRGLFYLKGGVAWSDVEDSVERTGFSAKDSGGAAGILLGGGVEYALTYNITTKLEYNYDQFGSNSFAIPGVTSGKDKIGFNQLKWGMNLKFD